MRDNTFSKKVFIKTVSDNLNNKYRKTIDDATQQELYQAVSEAVKDSHKLCDCNCRVSIVHLENDLIRKIF